MNSKLQKILVDTPLLPITVIVMLVGTWAVSMFRRNRVER